MAFFSKETGMHINDNDQTIFVIDNSAGAARIVMTTIATHKSSGPERLPIWWYQPKTDDELASIGVWLNEQRPSWSTWRDIAERQGRDAVQAEIGRAWSEHAIEACGAVMLNQGDDARDITLFAMLVTRNSEIIRHRFKSASLRKAFLKWYFTDVSAIGTFLLLEGCLIGPAHLAGLIDSIAAAEMAGGKSKARSQRVPSRLRKAA